MAKINKTGFMIDYQIGDLISLLESKEEKAYFLDLLFYCGFQTLPDKDSRKSEFEKPEPPETIQNQRTFEKIEQAIIRLTAEHGDNYNLTTESKSLGGYIKDLNKKIESSGNLPENVIRFAESVNRRSEYIKQPGTTWESYLSVFGCTATEEKLKLGA